MKNRHLSVQRLFLWICIGLLLSMTAITFILFSLTLEVAVLIAGAALIVCALVWVSSRKIKFPSPAQKQRIIIVSSQIHLFHCAGKNGALFFLCTS